MLSREVSLENTSIAECPIAARTLVVLLAKVNFADVFLQVSLQAKLLAALPITKDDKWL